MAEQSEWKGREDFVRLTVGKQKLGEGSFGKVFAGRIWFKGQKPKRVAVKFFKPDAAGVYFDKPEMDDEAIGYYEEAISRLRRAGVPLLRTGFVKHEGKWIQVQELFAHSKGSKINDARLPDAGRPIDSAIINDPESRKQLLDIIGRIINAGFNPHSDTVGMVKTSKGMRLVVHDLDFFAHVNAIKGKRIADVQRDLEKKIRNWLIPFRREGINHRDFLEELKKRVTHENGIIALRKIEAEQTRTTLG